MAEFKFLSFLSSISILGLTYGDSPSLTHRYQTTTAQKLLYTQPQTKHGTHSSSQAFLVEPIANAAKTVESLSSNLDKTRDQRFRILTILHNFQGRPSLSWSTAVLEDLTLLSTESTSLGVSLLCKKEKGVSPFSGYQFADIEVCLLDKFEMARCLLITNQHFSSCQNRKSDGVP